MKVYNKNFAKVKKVFSKLLVNFFQFKTTFQDRVSIYEDERIQQNEDQSYTTALSTTDGSGIEDKKLSKMEKVLYKLELMSDRLNDIADEYFEDIFDIEAGDCKSVNTANSSNRQLSTFFDNISFVNDGQEVESKVVWVFIFFVLLIIIVFGGVAIYSLLRPAHQKME